MTTRKAFKKYKDESAIIGRLLAGYADIELSLFHCVSVARNDFDTVYKAMFQTRGETRRIDMANIFGIQMYHDLELGTQFEMAISSTRYCLRIRNQYAHCLWYDDLSGDLAFTNLEEIAQTNGVINDLGGLTIRHTDVPTLTQQGSYFEYTESFLTWLNFEGRRLAGKPSTAQQKKPPKQLKQPPLYKAQQ